MKNVTMKKIKSITALYPRFIYLVPASVKQGLNNMSFTFVTMLKPNNLKSDQSMAIWNGIIALLSINC